MKLEDSILKTVREAMGLGVDDTSFDSELLIHINASLARINQNGVGNLVLVSDDTVTWKDFIGEVEVGSDIFHLVPLFVSLNTKLIFDPPPPSTVEQYARSCDELLWRLKITSETKGSDI